MTVIVLVLWQLIARIDQLVIATFSNAYSLGLYAAAVRIAEVPNVFSGILYTALVSRIAILEKGGKESSGKDFKKMFLLYFVLGSFFAIGEIITAPLLVHILYGQKFIEAVPILRAYALSIPGSFILTYSFSVYGVRNKQEQQVLIFVLGVIINVALIYILSPYFGMVGSALATSISYNFLAYVFFRFLR
jgi:O-antigen/teichoic acid export membrane protein